MRTNTKEATILAGKADLVKTEVKRAGSNFQVAITLNPKAASAIAAYTKNHVAANIHVVAFQDVVASPILREPIVGNRLVISGLSQEDAGKIMFAVDIKD